MRGTVAVDGGAVGETIFRHELVLLGMGEDGHTASLFPGTAALDETGRWVVENHVPQLDSRRMTFTFPLIGRVKAGGLSLRDVEQALRLALADGFFRNPQLSVAVEQYRSQRVFVMGEVRSPGPYPLVSDMTLIEALARAGGRAPPRRGSGT